MQLNLTSMFNTQLFPFVFAAGLLCLLERYWLKTSQGAYKRSDYSVICRNKKKKKN